MVTFLVDWTSILTGVIAVGLFLASLPVVARRTVQWRLNTAKRRTVGSVLASTPRSVVAPPDRRAVRRAIRARTAARFAGASPTAADEVDWLSRVAGLDYSVGYVGDNGSSWLHSLAESYAAFAARVSVRGLLGSTQPILDAEAALAREVSGLLHVHAQRAPLGDVLTDVVPHEVTGPFGRVGFVGIAPGTSALPHDLLVSWRRRRLVLPPASGTAPDGAELQLLAGSSAPTALLSQPNAYDGVLPALQSARMEKDARTGHSRLHLSITESTYSAHLRVRDLGPGAGSDLPRILTLSLLPVTTDDRIVIVRRSERNHSYQGHWAPGVNGNLDIPDARRCMTDATPDGVPDPVAALVREAAEELGMTLPAEVVAVRGLAAIHSADDNGTWVLACSAAVPQTFAEVVAATRYADPVAGRWELGGEICGVAIPDTRDQAATLMRWAGCAPDVMPHVVVCLAFYLDSLGLLTTQAWDWTDRGRLTDLPPRGVIERPLLR